MTCPPDHDATADAAPPAPRPEVERIERAMRAFKRIGEARRVQRRMQEYTGDANLDGSAFVALMRIAEHGPLRVTDLAAQLWLDLSVVSRKVRQLEDSGFVERAPDPADARASRVAVTAAGAQVATRVATGRHNYLMQLFARWSDRDTRRFAELLERFIDDVDASHETAEDPAT